jgi:FADH2 O2-dependent halogenase
MVAASSEDPQADTHWFRPEVDAFLAAEAQAAGIPYLDQTELAVQEQWPRWLLSGARLGQPLTIQAGFVLDASGDGAFLPRALHLANRAHMLHTNSWSVFGHFTGARLWQELLNARGARLADYPFPCDWAAQHQILDEGWMWQLRFDNDLLSAGFVLDQETRPPDAGSSPQQEWDQLVSRYPSLAEQFALAKRTLPADGLRRTGRLQRMTEGAAGENWALLPYTFGFIDALHSTGIAQTLCAIERLAIVFADHWNRPTLAGELKHYEQTLFAEITLIDQLVHACYLSRRRFAMFAAVTMLYFAATTTYERRRAAGLLPPGAAILGAEDRQWREIVRNVKQRLEHDLQSTHTDAAFTRYVAEAIAPYNTAGLCDPAAKNMYRHTAARKGD